MTENKEGSPVSIDCRFLSIQSGTVKPIMMETPSMKILRDEFRFIYCRFDIPTETIIPRTYENMLCYCWEINYIIIRKHQYNTSHTYPRSKFQEKVRNSHRY